MLELFILIYYTCTNWYQKNLSLSLINWPFMKWEPVFFVFVTSFFTFVWFTWHSSKPLRRNYHYLVQTSITDILYQLKLASEKLWHLNKTPGDLRVQIDKNAVINIGLVRLSPWEWLSPSAYFNNNIFLVTADTLWFSAKQKIQKQPP